MSGTPPAIPAVAAVRGAVAAIPGAGAAGSTVALPPLEERSLRFEAMGGNMLLRVATEPGDVEAADRTLHHVAARIGVWAARLTRFDQGSELCRLNAEATRPSTTISPTMAALLARAQDLWARTGGLVDVTLLEERLAAEHGTTIPGERGHGMAVPEVGIRWWLEPATSHPGRRGRWRVHRDLPTVFDLDGVGKGWIADRALEALGSFPAVLVDADGDIAMRGDERVSWGVAIADPAGGDDVALLARPVDRAPGRLGMATSGTTVFRWSFEGGWAHHLIDPRTGNSAGTDVVQATVIADGALLAEAMAKAAVIAGSDDAWRLLDGPGIHAAFLLRDDGRLLTTEGGMAWLA
jgi:thiamine biosynthesis lipoprotein